MLAAAGLSLLITASFSGALGPGGLAATSQHLLACSDPDPLPGDTYHVVYETSDGAITSFVGQTGNGFPVPGPGEATLVIGTASPMNVTLIHRMFCYADQGHGGAFPFRVDLSNGQVVWD